MNVRSTLPAIGAGAAALAIVGLTAIPASAHVTVTPSTTAAGAYAVLTFSVGHGCEGSPTTKLTFAVPENIPAVTPTVNPGWTIKKVMKALDEPIKDAHGNEITERVAEVVYTAKTPLADGYRDTVAMQMQLPDEVGETLVFPVVQSCVKGETGWTETAADGQDPETLETPAPILTITEATDEGHGHSHDDGEAEEGEEHSEEGDTTASAEGSKDSEDSEDSEGSEDSDGNGLAIGGLVAGIGGLALGGLALARSGKKA